MFKPQSAFFEAYGSAGIGVLERTLSDIRAAGALCLLDVKRGDLSSTMDAYAAAYLADGSPLAADAITLSPYLGFGSLASAIEQALSQGRGVYVLALTSNPEGPQVQHARVADGRWVGQVIIDEAARYNTGPGPRIGRAGGRGDHRPDRGRLLRASTDPSSPRASARRARRPPTCLTFSARRPPWSCRAGAGKSSAAGPDPTALRAMVEVLKGQMNSRHGGWGRFVDLGLQGQRPRRDHPRVERRAAPAGEERRHPGAPPQGRDQAVAPFR